MTSREDPFREIEELFDQLTAFGGAVSDDVPVDVVETDDEVVVQAELPGRDPDAIQVQLHDDRRLLIEASEPDGDLEGRYVTRERSSESLSRAVRLPAAVDEAETEASYDRGVLTVHLGKLTGDEEGTEIPVN